MNLTGRVQELAEGAGIECATVRTHPEEVRFGIRPGGQGRMKQAAAGVLGREPIDDNEADAVHVARWAAAEYA